MIKTVCICLTVLFVVMAVCGTIINTSKKSETIVVEDIESTKFSVGQTIFDTYVVMSVKTEGNFNMYEVHDKTTLIIYRIFETNGVYSFTPVYDTEGNLKRVEWNYADTVPKDCKFQYVVAI